MKITFDDSSPICNVIAIAIMIVLMSLPGVMAGQNSRIMIMGEVRESAFGNGLVGAKIYGLDGAYNRVDSVTSGAKMINNGVAETTPRFVFPTLRRDSVHTLEVVYPGYEPKVIKVAITNEVELKCDVPTIFLDKESHKLDEVVVAASKIKFYNRGDTLVYNADAFQLAEGSMLDALISQLPGVELNDKGQIRVNGEFVESLLLNGKHFFDGNNNLMLKNLSAYMVKSVEVYKGLTDDEKWMDNGTVPSHLTMDVKLKKLYSIGITGNLQGGAGTDSRYLGRMFLSTFSPTITVNMIGSINNLNDDRQPGSSDSWEPDQKPSGQISTRIGGINCDYSSLDKKHASRGWITYEGNKANTITVTDRTNFFNTGDTYDYSTASVRDRADRLSGHIQRSLRLSRINTTVEVDAGISHRKPRSMTDTHSWQDEGEINSLLEESIGRSHKMDIGARVNSLYRVPKSTAIILASVEAKYSSAYERMSDIYEVVYPLHASDDLSRRNFRNVSPVHDLDLSATTGIIVRTGRFRTSIKYVYDFAEGTKDIYNYTLDQMKDMDFYGAEAGDFAYMPDAPNSFLSRTLENTHSLNLYLDGNIVEWDSDVRLQLSLQPQIGVRESRLNYLSDSQLYPVNRNSVIASCSNQTTKLAFVKGSGKRGEDYYAVEYGLDLETRTPDLLHIVDVVDTTNPMNIRSGNGNLKNSYESTHNLKFVYRPADINLRNILTCTLGHTANAIVRGYTLDTGTGVRHTRSYNVRGNRSSGLRDDFYMQFGGKDQFTVSSAAGVTWQRCVDMLGLDVDIPAPSTVSNCFISEDAKLTWQTGRQSLTGLLSVTNRRTCSERDGFNDINALHVVCGMTGLFNLPAGFGVNTDFKIFIRRGYGTPELDTTDAVWNARLTYTPPCLRNWTVALDGFDLLHRLSNVNYAVNATGRTVTLTNTLPRYMMVTLQYRFSRSPRK